MTVSPWAGKPGDDQRHRGAQVGRHDLGAEQAVDAGHERGIALELDAGAKPSQFLNMHEAVLEDGLAHRRGAARHAHERDELGLQIRGEAGEGLGLDRNRLQAPAVPRDADASRPLFDLYSRRAQGLKHLLQQVGTGTIEHHISAGHGSGHGISAGLDAIGKDGMLGAMQRLASLDP